MFRKTIAAMAMMVAASGAQAASYSFAFEFDGTSLTETGTDTLAGTVLSVGDTYNLMISAAGNGFWIWNGGTSQIFPMNPRRSGGNAIGHNATMDISLDGSSVASDTEAPGSRCCAEIGMTHFDNGLSNGLKYDKLSMDYELLSIQTGTTVALLGGLWNDELWNPSRGKTTFTAAPIGAIPLPASLGLYGAVVLAGGVIARRRKKAKAA